MTLSKRNSRLLVLGLLLALILMALVPVAHTSAQAGVWTAHYYGNRYLEGPVLHTETLPGPYLLREWPYGEGPRMGGVPDDEFSARFTTTHTFLGGNVKFMLRSDDGARLYLNNEVIIDKWYDSEGSYFVSRVLTVPAGTYTVRVEYYDAFGDNVVEARFEPTTDAPSFDDAGWRPGGSGGGGFVPFAPSAPSSPPFIPSDGQGGGGPLPAFPGSPSAQAGLWKADYFGNRYLEGPVLYSEVFNGPDLAVFWPYGEGPRMGGVPDDEFSARFQTVATFYGGYVKFQINSDDGSRLYVNNTLILDQWKDRAATWFDSRVLPIPAGTYVITVEYYDAFGANSVEARFQPTTDEPTVNDMNFTLDGSGGGGPAPAAPSFPVPADGQGGGGPAVPGGASDIVIDDGDKGFVWSGNPGWEFGIGGLLNNLYLYTGNAETTLDIWGRWNPLITRTGYWDVYAYVPNHGNSTTNARYRVYHAGVLSPAIAVNQAANAGSWVWLGSYWFTEGPNQYLYLNDLTFEAYNSTDVLLDAVRFVYSSN